MNQTSPGATSLLRNIISFLSRLIGFFLVLPIRLYQKVLSPILPNACIYYPSCSHYAVHAIQKHGPIKGPILGTLRIVRCNQLFLGGVDEVTGDLTIRGAIGKYGEFYRGSRRNREEK